MRVRGDPALLAPRQHLLDLDDDLARLRRDLYHLADRAHLEALADLHVDRADGQAQGRLAVDVGGRVQPLVGEVDGVVLEPGRVDDAVAILGREILAGRAVDVQLDRDRRAAPARDDAQRYPLRGRPHRRQGSGMRAGLDLRRGDDGAAGQVEARVLVRGVFNEHAARGARRQLVVVAFGPAIVGIDELRRGGDDLAQVELDLRQQAVAVERGRKGLALRQRQQGFLPRPPTQRQAGRIAGGQPGHHHDAALRGEAQAADRGLRPRVLPRPEPADPLGLVGRRGAHLAMAPVRAVLLVRRAQRVGLVMRDGLETVLAPAPHDRADVMAALDRQLELLAVRIDDGVGRGQLSQSSLPARGGDEAAWPRLAGADVGRMEEHEPARAERVQRQLDGLIGQEDAVADLERNAPGDDGADGRVGRGLRHLGRDALARQVCKRRVACQRDRAELRRRRPVMRLQLGHR
ncbi:MAG: hypothetical protein BWY52_03098 [Chloroflexi bacterium ADurb.Bin325]|nr:MAG: hypothetical protein BWY52_03098 [Chloroflexi bacterium ADurb.Bin325]